MRTEDKQRKAARNQALFREVNERIEEISDLDGVPPHELWEFLCECADESCTMTIKLTRDEYEAARRVPTHFPIKAGHELPEVERTVEEHERYVVVEKQGTAALIAAEVDPRRARP